MGQHLPIALESLPLITLHGLVDWKDLRCVNAWGIVGTDLLRVEFLVLRYYVLPLLLTIIGNHTTRVVGSRD